MVSSFLASVLPLATILWIRQTDYTPPIVPRDKWDSQYDFIVGESWILLARLFYWFSIDLICFIFRFSWRWISGSRCSCSSLWECKLESSSPRSWRIRINPLWYSTGRCHSSDDSNRLVVHDRTSRGILLRPVQSSVSLASRSCSRWILCPQLHAVCARKQTWLRSMARRW